MMLLAMLRLLISPRSPCLQPYFGNSGGSIPGPSVPTRKGNEFKFFYTTLNFPTPAAAYLGKIDKWIQSHSVFRKMRCELAEK